MVFPTTPIREPAVVEFALITVPLIEANVNEHERDFPVEAVTMSAQELGKSITTVWLVAIAGGESSWILKIAEVLISGA
jgi:hypothetical protein